MSILQTNAIMNGEAVEIQNLRLYPIMMRDYEDFLRCKPVLLLRQSTLPAEYVGMNFLKALYAFDCANLAKGLPAGFIVRVVHLFKMVLRDCEIIEDEVRFKIDPTTRELETILLTPDVEIESKKFAELRQAIAEQNGEELPNEAANVDLIEAEQILAEKGARPLDHNIIDLIDTVAYHSGITMNEIQKWTVLHFETRRKTITRNLLYEIYKKAESSGMATFPKGIPYPSHEFNPAKGLTQALIPESEFMAKFKTGMAVQSNP